MSKKLETSPRVLAIHAHPDDVEFQCAGTLARLKELGCSITIVTMTAGDCGSAEHGPLEIAAIRREEARKAAEMLGAEYFCLEFLDLRIVVDQPSRDRVTECLRRARPEIVLTAPPMDYMSDHEMTSRLVRDACFMASVPNYATQQLNPAPITKKIPHLYYVDAVEGLDIFGRPQPFSTLIDITAHWKLKREMLACHASQRNWLLQQHGVDEFLDACERWSSQRGKELGVPYAEAFAQHKGHPFPHHDILSELLGSKDNVR